MTTPTDFARQVMELAGEIPDNFTPYVHYDQDGDCVRFFTSPDPYYGERIDNVATVYRSIETNEIIGSLIKNITKICNSAPCTAIAIIDGKIQLHHVIQSMIDSPQQKNRDTIVHVYEKLAAITKENNLDTEELCVKG